jgi:eukaryotic translation initiation factor 2C
MIYEHCYQYMRSTTPVSLCEFSNITFHDKADELDPAVYYAHLASNRARSHERVPASEGPRSGKQFVEEQQDKAIAAGMGKTQPPSTHQPNTEAQPLMRMGGELTGPLLGRLLTGMWYI